MASISYQAFETAIADAERLLVLFDKLPQQERQPNEVLKRAALIMTLTAWETYIEALLLELVEKKACGIQGSYAGDFILKKLPKEPEDARTQLNVWLSKHGDIVHHGRENADPKAPHLVKRDEVEKAIKFFKELVKVTDGVAL
mgnify:CR=1 FL=1